MFQQVTILSPGLIGGSLGQALHAAGLAGRIVTWDPDPAVWARAAATSWCDEALATPEAAVTGSDAVLLAAPVEALPGLLETIAPTLATGAFVTDTGSVKAPICATAEKLVSSGIRFVGSHPMAGSEKTGIAFARGDLFAGRSCLLTPTDLTSPETTATARALWEALGMRVTELPPERHDALVARLSHLPHLLAALLCASLEDDAASGDLALAGPGLRDTTRIAAGSDRLWTGILDANREALSTALERWEGELRVAREALDRRDTATLQSLLARGRRVRQALETAAPELVRTP